MPKITRVRYPLPQISLHQTFEVVNLNILSRSSTLQSIVSDDDDTTYASDTAQPFLESETSDPSTTPAASSTSSPARHRRLNGVYMKPPGEPGRAGCGGFSTYDTLLAESPKE
ncbi:hypothetical protein HGRIS_002978 [Hohenbuehelia grisea]|uniref:Uncharacterized protein n=1 Tax=Hohenbuehelia grisea TaxID=104357 RepID=A0ABR3JM39_9AGAR